MNFNNKIILITGASSGIGAALAVHLAKEANTLVLIARRKDALQHLKQQLLQVNPHLKVVIIAKDITIIQSQQEIKNLLDEEKIKIDMLVNNAGIGDEALFHKSETLRLQNVIDLNISSVVNFTHLFVNDFLQQPKDKAIIFVSSGAGIAYMPGSAVYSASKHFITAFAMNLNAELKPYGIDIRIVAPGPVDSEFDKHANINAGMKGGPSQTTRITAEECAADTVRLLKQNKFLVVPGKKIRRLMSFYLWFP